MLVLGGLLIGAIGVLVLIIGNFAEFPIGVVLGALVAILVGIVTVFFDSLAYSRKNQVPWPTAIWQSIREAVRLSLDLLSMLLPS